MAANPRSRTRGLLLLLIGAIALATVAVSGLLAWRDHVDLRRQTERELANLTGLVEEHLRVMLAANQVQMNRVADILDGRAPRAVDATELRRRLLDLVGDLPGGHSLWVFDADADLVATSLRADLSLNVADREYFSAVRDGDGAFISPLIWGKLGGGHFFVTSRRLTDAEGRFVGVVQSSIDPGYILRRWGELAPHADSAITVVRRDGGVVLRSPPPPSGVEPRFPAAAPAMQRVLHGPPSGVVPIHTVGGDYTRPDRIGAYRRLPDFPLHVIASRTVAAVERPWLIRSMEQWAVAAVMLALLTYLGLRVVRSAADLDRNARQLARALRDKDLLFQEIHHRIKNNLQIIAGMLTMQSLLVRDEQAQAALKEALDRIHTMGLVHQTLYQRNEANDVDLGTYLQAVVEHFRRSYGADQAGITISVLAERRMIEMDRAIPIALIATEALTNALKHAFPDHRPGAITITLSEPSGHILLAIADDGVGLPPQMAAENGASLGLRLIRSLAQQVGGEARVETGDGTRIVVTFAAAGTPAAQTSVAESA